MFFEAVGPSASRLKRTTVPVDGSIAGTVFTTGKTRITGNAYEEKDFYAQSDRLSGYGTGSVLTVALTVGGKPVGVMQFLNKQGGMPFGAEDLDTADAIAASIAPKISEFVAEKDNFELLGFSVDRQQPQGSVMFVDLTNSSILFETMNAASAVDLINEFLEMTTEEALGNGAIVDKYVGDGAILVFNVPERGLSESCSRAIQAATTTVGRFGAMKSAWIANGFAVSDVYVRIAIASGPLMRIHVGHRQYETATVAGKAMWIAAKLCDAAPRTRNVILLDEAARASMSADQPSTSLSAVSLIAHPPPDMVAYEILPDQQ